MGFKQYYKWQNKTLVNYNIAFISENHLLWRLNKTKVLKKCLIEN